MIKRYFPILILFIAALSLSVISYGQPVKVKATLDSTRILLGDQINLRLEIEKPANLQVEFTRIPDTLAEKIEIVKRFPIDTTLLDNQQVKLVQNFLITCFDSGVYRIPPFMASIKQEGLTESVYTEELILEVMTMKIDTTRGPTDIKMPYDAPLTLKEVTPYILGIMLVGAILFLLLYSIKRKKKNLPFLSMPAKPKEPAHVVALRELDRIKEEKIWQKEKIKEYYSEVTDVLRTYIEDRFSIPAMEQTTDEILTSFKVRKDLIGEKQMNHLVHILPLADLVKFAKYQPLPDDHSLVLVNAYFFVNDTKPEEPVAPPKKEIEEDNNAKENPNTLSNV